MKKTTRLLALLMAAAALFAGCGQNAAPEENGSGSENTVTEAAPQGDRVWSHLGGRMENFAQTYESLTITALEYALEGEAKENYVTGDADVIDAAFRALNDITVVKETSDYASDATESFVFVTDTGERYAVRFNQHNLDAGDIYLVEHDAPLWKLADSIRAASREQAASAAKTVEEHQAELQPSPPPAPIPSSNPAAKSGESDRIYSQDQDFSISYDTSLRAEVTEEGSIRLYASDREDMSYVEVRRIDNGPDAKEFLEEQLSQVQAEQDDIVMQSGSAEQVDIVGLDLYGIWANYRQGDDYVSMASYAENIQGGILVYTGYFLEDTAETVLNGLENALLTAEYGMNNAMRIPSDSADAPAP